MARAPTCLPSRWPQAQVSASTSGPSRRPVPVPLPCCGTFPRRQHRSPPEPRGVPFGGVGTHTHTLNSLSLGVGGGEGLEAGSLSCAPPPQNWDPPHTHTHPRSWGSPPPPQELGKLLCFPGAWETGGAPPGSPLELPGCVSRRPANLCPQVLRAVEHPPRHGLGPLGRSLATAPAPRPHRSALPGPGTQIQAALQHGYRRASLRGVGWEEGLARSVPGVGCCTPGRRAGGPFWGGCARARAGGPFWGGLCPGRSGRTG